MSGRVAPDTRYRELRFSQSATDEVRARVGPEVFREAIAIGACRRLHVISLCPRATARELMEVFFAKLTRWTGRAFSAPTSNVGRPLKDSSGIHHTGL